MIFTDIEKRVCIKYLFLKGLSAKTAFDELQSTLGSSAPGQTTIYDWYRKFKQGNFNVEEAPRIGRPKITISEDKVVRLIRKDPYFTPKSMEPFLGIDHRTIKRILVEDLDMVKVSTKWLPKILSSDQKQIRVDCARKMISSIESMDDISYLFTQDETWLYMEYGRRHMWLKSGMKPPVVEKRHIASKKTMISVSFSPVGLFKITALPKNQNFNKAFYVDNVLSDLHNYLGGNKRSNVSKNVVLHTNNAPSHRVDDELHNLGINRLVHPPYTPDLAPCDFFLFGYIKMRLEGRSYDNADNIVQEVTNIMLNISQETYLRVFQEWIRRLKACVDTKGEYVE